MFRSSANAASAPTGWSLPASFQWKDRTDCDGYGGPDYTTSDSHERYAFWEATEAVNRGITIIRWPRVPALIAT